MSVSDFVDVKINLDTFSDTKHQEMNLISNEPKVYHIQALPGDHRKYRVLRLENGLKVILVEDAKETLASVTLKVAAGSFHEPKEFPGLAHFLEHMVFMGSKKFPKEKLFHEFIGNHQGTYNGNTTEEATTFPWSINKESLNEALDIFAQFFIDPLLSPDAMAREIIAVDNEFIGNTQSNAYRFFLAFQTLMNPEHPAARFDAGNQETLPIETKKDEILSLLRKFHSQYYVANNMTLLISSSHSLEELEKMVRTHFNAIPKSSQEIPKLVKPLRYIETTKKILTIESKDDDNLLNVCFILNEKQTLELKHAVDQITYLLATRIPNGLFNTLKDKNLVMDGSSSGIGVSVNVEYTDETQLEIGLIFPLTPLGKSKIDEMVAIILEYIHFIKKHALDERFFEERQKINERTFQFEPDSTEPNLIYNLNHYGLERLLIGNCLLKHTPFPAETITRLLEHMTADNLFLGLTTTDLTQKNTAVEPWTKVRYSINSLSSDLLTYKIQGNYSFEVPGLNPYIPEQFELEPLNPHLKLPRALYLSDTVRLWLSQDHHFSKPLLTTHCYLLSNLVSNTIQNKICSTLFQSLVSTAISKQFSSFMRTSNLSFMLLSNLHGLMLAVSGYSDKQYLFILDIFKTLCHLEFTEEELELQKKQILNYYKNLKHQSSLDLAQDNLSLLLNNNLETPEAMISEYEKIDSKILKDYIRSYLGSVGIEIYCHGNTSPAAMHKFSQEIESLLPTKKAKPIQFPMMSYVELPPKSNLNFRVLSEHPECALVLNLQAPDLSDDTKLLVFILAAIIQSEFFDALRTKEQLAYTINCSNYTLGNASGLRFIIVSPNQVAERLKISKAELGQYLRMRLEKFLLDFDLFLENYPENEFLTQKDNYTKIYRHHLCFPSSPGQSSSVFSRRLELNKYQFHTVFELLDPDMPEDIYESLTLEKMRAVYKEMIHEKTRRCLAVHSDNNAKDNPGEDNPGEDNRGDSKATSEHQVKPVIFSDFVKSRSNAQMITDISHFKRSSQLYPDSRLKGEAYITSIREFNQSSIREARLFVHDYDVEFVLRTLELEFENPFSGSKPTWDESRDLAPIVLGYCFRHYNEKDRKAAKAEKHIATNKSNTV